jgi:hypothetical protein
MGCPSASKTNDLTLGRMGTGSKGADVDGHTALGKKTLHTCYGVAHNCSCKKFAI